MLRPDRKITEILNREKFTLSVEIVPPRNGSSSEQILDQLDRLTNAGSQFMSVTKGAGGSLRGGSLPIAQTIKESFRLPCIAHFTCRDLLPEEVENQLVDHHLFGIRNILALRGDPPQGVENWMPRAGSFPYAYMLVEQIRALNQGRYLERRGFSINEREQTDFCVGVACYPDHPIAKERVEHFKLKIDAGAEYAISQMLFDADSYERFLEEIAAAGSSVPILPGTRLLKSKSQAMKMSQRFEIPVPKWYLDVLPESDSDASSGRSLEAFMLLTEKLKKMGAPGTHIFVLSDTELAADALALLAPRTDAPYGQASL